MQKIQRMGQSGGLCAVLVAALCLSACGSADKGGSPAGLLHRQPPQKKQVSLPAAADPTADMGVAVSANKAPSPVTVKFQIQGRPQPGEPLNVEFALVPDPTVTAVAAKFEGDGTGLTLVSGEQVAPVEKPAPNVPIRHTVVALPSSDGIYILTATLTVTTDGDPKVRAFTIPVIAGKGLPPLTAHADPAAKKPRP